MNYRRLLLATLTLLVLTPRAFALFRERTVSYYGYVYGSDGDYCTCKISPCGYDDLLGETTYSCDGTSSSWGITDGCFTRTVTTYGDYCYQAPAGTATTSDANAVTRTPQQRETDDLTDRISIDADARACEAPAAQ
jgi:hypothetical protein